MKPPFRISVVRMLGFAFLASLLSPPAFGTGITVRFVGEPEASSAVGPWYQAVSEEWAKKTGNKLEYIGRLDDARRPCSSISNSGPRKVLMWMSTRSM